MALVASAALLLWPAAVAVTPAAALPGLGGQYSINVRGVITNNGVPTTEPETRMQLAEADAAMVSVGAGSIDPRGNLSAITEVVKFASPQPQVVLLTKVNHSGPCVRRIVIPVPASGVTVGPIPLNVADLGTVNLALQFPGETVDCNS
ncbi:hypothetical protein EBN03_14235 [Nocardia stercoris]|uniref:Uncharacterized protein n=1 Tax=Nocardia stercoris TaxID=2483361 RepID=A0A3M2L461_9NOCA|nr:hypothetical protein EBN03_14235 [Nocardia stercoris]